MAYWLDEGWHNWPEIVEAGTPAAGLYARCGAYIADQTTDGYIPAGMIRMYGTAEWAQRLVDVGLWAVEGNGYRDLRYFPLNKSREQIEKAKADAAARQRKRRHNTPDQRNTSRVTHATVTPKSRAPSRVSHNAPTLPPSGGRAGAPAHTRAGAHAPATHPPPPRPQPQPQHEPCSSYAGTTLPAPSCSTCPP